MEAKNVGDTFIEVQDQQASNNWSLLRQNVITKVWLLILELKIQKLSYNGYF